MPESSIANKQLATLLGVLSHPFRIRIVQELRHGEKDVNTLQQVVGIAHSGVSQHLSVLRANRLVVERRIGRRVVYRLVEPTLADWLLGGLRYLETVASRDDEVRSALKQARESWPDPSASLAVAKPAESRESGLSSDSREEHYSPG